MRPQSVGQRFDRCTRDVKRTQDKQALFHEADEKIWIHADRDKRLETEIQERASLAIGGVDEMNRLMVCVKQCPTT